MGKPNALASPKSANLMIFPSELISRFCGLRSLWNILFECRKINDCNIWNRKLWHYCGGSALPTFFMYFFKSNSRYSKTKYNCSLENNTSLSSTMFGCFKFFSNDISLMAVEGTPSSSFSSLIFLMATVSPVKVFIAL